LLIRVTPSFENFVVSAICKPHQLQLWSKASVVFCNL
jgi:hypothetical protein